MKVLPGFMSSICLPRAVALDRYFEHKKSLRSGWFIIAIAAAALLVSLGGSAFGTTWYIKPDGTGDAPTIQAGVDLASEGDVILVAAGVYSATTTFDMNGTSTVACVVIGKNVRLLSESGPQSTTISSATAKFGIYVHDVGSSTEINGFLVQTMFEPYFCSDSANPLDPLPPFLHRGIGCRNASPVIKNNHIIGNGAAIELLGSPATVTENVIAQAANGLVCRDGSDAVISGNTIHSCGFLVPCQASSPLVIDNEIFDGCAGISVSGGSSVIRDNFIHDVSQGASWSATSVTFENNQIARAGTSVYVVGAIGVSRIAGNLLVYQNYAAISLSDNSQASILIEENTIDGTAGTAILCVAISSPNIRRNIITSSTWGIGCAMSSLPTMECNDVVATQGNYVGDCSDQTGLNGNISLDPQFCGISNANNYGLHSDSPCAPGNHPAGLSCGRIGARDVACGTVATKSTTWGAIKAIYRR
jgi:hypothetical protein